MTGFLKSIFERILVWSHYAACAISGVVTFGFAAYLLDIGGFRSSAHMTGGIGRTTITAVIIVLLVFAGADMAMKRLTGKHGSF